MTSRGFHYLSQEVIKRPFSLKCSWKMTPIATVTVHHTMNSEHCQITSWRTSLDFDIMCKFCLTTIAFIHNSALNWHFFHYKTAARECCSRAPLSAILIWDKNQSSTLENSISLMRYEYSSKRKSEIVSCFQTNPLKVIWSSGANYRAFWAASCLHRTPPPP